jgi:hypothetical protein
MYFVGFVIATLVSNTVLLTNYEGVSKRFRTETITKYTFTFAIAR